MFFVQKTIGFMAVLAVIGAADAATSTARPSVMRNSASRMPTMRTYLDSTNPTLSGTMTTSSLLDNAKCIDAYLDCAREYCGDDFEDCTTRVLFHGQMPNCISTLSQCAANGITSLFGTSVINDLAKVASTVDGEVKDYTYPTDGSVLGQMITAAAINNRLDTTGCVNRYTACVRQTNVCGVDFELCTSNREFKKQRVMCDNILARCQNEGVKELFGSIDKNVTPSSESRIGEMISDGADLAATNAVATCYRVTDQCILGACAANPYRCTAGAGVETANTVAKLKSGAGSNTAITDVIDATTKDTITASDVSSYIANACQSTVGANKFCYMTARASNSSDVKLSNPKASQLNDPFEQLTTFSELYNKRMNDAMKLKIADMVKEFDTDSKKKCTETIRSCAMAACGGGNGAACYTQVFGADKGGSINTGNTYDEIKSACAAVVNTDPNCQYAALNATSYGTYAYAYNVTDAFDTLFPKKTGSGASDDPIGAVEGLNASLSTAYNTAGINKIRTSCENVAKNCIRDNCGEDYENCFRMRNDIMSNLTNTGTDDFDESMNKVGGVLDYTIVLGLCLDTVKNNQFCKDHLAIATANIGGVTKDGTWGDNNSIRNAWIDAGSASVLSQGLSADMRQAIDENGNLLCTGTNPKTKMSEVGICDGNIYIEPRMITSTLWKQNEATNTVFRELVYDIEKEAQAKYQAKLTKEQNLCMRSNSGGLVGANGESTYQWVKLKTKKAPTDYNVMGLKATDIVPSNELYGSFCRMRVQLVSNDPKVNEVLKNANWNSAFFPVGEPFVCGSWIPASELETLAKAAADDATDDMEARQRRTRTWTSILGGLAGGTGGLFAMDAIQGNGVLTGGGNQKNFEKQQNLCTDRIDKAKVELRKLSNTATKDNVSYASNAVDILDAALNAARKLEITDGASRIDEVEVRIADLRKITAESTNAANIAADVIRDANALRTVCEDAAEAKSGGWKNNGWTGKTIAGVASAGIGTIVANRLTKDIQDTNLDKAQKEAYQEWMNTVGSKITCTIGGDEVGGYMDKISTAIE